MEYAQGGDLQAHIKRKRTARQFFPEKTILKWLIQAVCALQYLHQLGKIHRLVYFSQNFDALEKFQSRFDIWY